jgi:hypothetical protein
MESGLHVDEPTHTAMRKEIQIEPALLHDLPSIKGRNGRLYKFFELHDVIIVSTRREKAEPNPAKRSFQLAAYAFRRDIFIPTPPALIASVASSSSARTPPQDFCTSTKPFARFITQRPLRQPPGCRNVGWTCEQRMSLSDGAGHCECCTSSSL